MEEVGDWEISVFIEKVESSKVDSIAERIENIIDSSIPVTISVRPVYIEKHCVECPLCHEEMGLSKREITPNGMAYRYEYTCNRCGTVTVFEDVIKEE